MDSILRRRINKVVQFGNKLEISTVKGTSKGDLSPTNKDLSTVIIDNH